MVNHELYTEQLQWHNAIDDFNYNLVIDWAIEHIRQGKEMEIFYTLASFSKPVDSYEIKPYVSEAIKTLGLEEKYEVYSVIAHAHYYLVCILKDYRTRHHLIELYDLCNANDHQFGLSTFYCLYHAWHSLEVGDDNYYYEGATIENINDLLKEEATLWINKYIHRIDIEEVKKEHIKTITPPYKKTKIWERVKRFWKI